MANPAAISAAFMAAAPVRAAQARLDDAHFFAGSEAEISFISSPKVRSA